MVFVVPALSCHRISRLLADGVKDESAVTLIVALVVPPDAAAASALVVVSVPAVKAVDLLPAASVMVVVQTPALFAAA